MTFEDVPLDRPPSHQPLGTRSSPTRWIILAAGAVLVGALLTLWWMSRARPTPTTPAPTQATEAPSPKRPKAEAGPLPPLAESDTYLRDLISALSQHPVLAKLLATKGLVRGATLAVIQIGDGKTPASPLTVLRPASRLQIAGATSGRIDPANYSRWDGATGALISVDPIHAAQLYVSVKPLFDEAYGELGHPNGNFDEAIVRAIRTLDDTPQLKTEPTLSRHQSYFEHENPDLKALLPVQKQLLLIGPDNRRKVMQWLKQLATNLDLKID